MGKGLDEVYPYSETTAVDILLREAEKMLSPHSDTVQVGPKHAGRIWGFISKFIMLDRFSKTLRVAEVYPGRILSKRNCTADYIGRGSNVSAFLLNLTLLTVLT